MTSASEGSNWTETYGYDQYGNRTSVSVSSSYLPTFAPAPAMDASNKNRFATSAGFAYDNSGNLTQAPVVPGGATQTFGYDAENKLINFNIAAATYAYDGDGRRVQKGVGSSTTVFVYDATGKLAAEYSNTSTTGSGTKYITTDHLGSTRIVTDVSGAVLARHDYLPFGEEIPALFGNRSLVTGYNNGDDTRQKFTAKERDTESGLDYFLARYFSGPQGRFTTPDWSRKPEPIPYADLDSPQSLNLYAYVRNNPLNHVDGDGHCGWVCVAVIVVSVAITTHELIDWYQKDSKKREAVLQKLDNCLSGKDANSTEEDYEALTHEELKTYGRGAIIGIKNATPAGVPTSIPGFVVDQVKDYTLDRLSESARREEEEREKQRKQQQQQQKEKKKKKERDKDEQQKTDPDGGKLKPIGAPFAY